jgi:hypothetical protein
MSRKAAMLWRSKPYPTVNPLLKLAVDWVSVGEPPANISPKPRYDIFEYRPSLFAGEIPPNLIQIQRQIPVASYELPPAGNPLHLDRILRRFVEYYHKDPARGFEQPRDKLFTPIHKDLQSFRKGVVLPDLADWLIPADLTMWHELMSYLPVEQYPFVILGPNAGPQDLVNALRNNPWASALSPEQVLVDALNRFRQKGSTATTFGVESSEVGAVPRFTYMHADPASWQTGESLHELLHAAAPFSRKTLEIGGKVGNSGELDLAVAIPFLSAKELEHWLQRTKGKLRPFGMIQHGLTWKRLLVPQKAYIEQTFLPWEYANSPLWDMQFRNWLSDSLKANFASQDLPYKVVKYILQAPYDKELSDLMMLYYLYHEPLYMGIAIDRLLSQGVDPRRITRTDTLRALATLPQSHFAWEPLIKGPTIAEARDIRNYVTRNYPGLAVLFEHAPNIDEAMIRLTSRFLQQIPRR